MNTDDYNFNSLIGDIATHYHHACEKHPYFADKWTNEDHQFFEEFMKLEKEILAECARHGEMTTRMVIDAEIAEVFESITGGDMQQAREEIFDTIAVLLRMVDVIDGFQKFGNPVCVERSCKNHVFSCNDSRVACLKKGGVCGCQNCCGDDTCTLTKKAKNTGMEGGAK